MKYIFVDLDKTFIKKDITLYLFFKLLKKNFLSAMYALFVLSVYGEMHLKKYLSKFIYLIDFEYIDTLVNKKILSFLEKKESEVKIVLATGAHIKIAKKITERYLIFEKWVIATDKINCVGLNKLTEIKKNIAGEAFMYIGDEWIDFPIWEEAFAIGIVTKDRKLLSTVKNLSKKVTVF